MTTLSNIDSSTNIKTQQFIYRCLMNWSTTYSLNATALPTLPGFCGVFLGFTIDSNIAVP
ncbi:hypothetical protein MTR67_001024 [Solanum verrucosum]|uniref:Uncharacterized protein n=1 Tax=Solanum verrucosum TaxID=315347 RepID=A0AAF0PTG4_SOLVR|nr:hypothetical protein MTR67_001024 [Solanum verrucosum]